MAKFKVGDKVRVREDLVIGGYYSDYMFTYQMEEYKGKILTIKTDHYDECYSLEEVGYYWTDEMLEEVNKYEMKKTFREVIADIKEGEIWECTRENARVREIKMNGEGNDSLLVFNFGQMTRDVRASIQGGDTFRLKRKEYTFQEAFKAYEEGKEIESCAGMRYKKINSVDKYFSTHSNEWVKAHNDILFNMIEIRNEWYIND